MKCPASQWISVPVVYPPGSALVHPGTAQLVNIQRHKPVSNEAQHLSQNLVVRSL